MATRIERIWIDWQTDEDPDLSWLEKSPGDEYYQEDQARLNAYGREWWMDGVRARAEVSYPYGQGSRRLETLSSGGLWGIESDSGPEYRREVELEELTDLKGHLEAFGVATGDFWEQAGVRAPCRKEGA